MPSCAICGMIRLDLSRHLKEQHQISVKEYYETYKADVVDASVNDKRKQTCLEVYGNPNYRNEEARKLSYEVYEGGHPLKDPEVIKKGQQTKLELYGDPGFTNRSKASETCLKKYGVKNVGQIKEVKQKAVKTLIERYGRVINYDYVPPYTKEDLIELHVNQKLTLAEIGAKYDKTEACIGYWMKKSGIPVTKRRTISYKREFISVRALVEIFFKECQENGKVLSFPEYGKINDKNMQKMKRSFNTGCKYNLLREELFMVALCPDKWPEFLSKLT